MPFGLEQPLFLYFRAVLMRQPLYFHALKGTNGKKSTGQNLSIFGAVPVVKSEPIGEAYTSSRDVVFALFL